MNKKVLVPIANGTEELEAIAIIDTLRRAGAEVTVASVQELEVVCNCKTKIIADKLISECQSEKFDLIVLPGGLPGGDHLRDSEVLTKMLKEQAASERLYAAICASPVVVLQHHGLLNGKRATVNPALVDKMENKDHIYQRTVVDGNCITSQSRGTSLEFSIKLIELLYDKEKAKTIADDMLLKLVK
jgi:protein deglycase